MRLSMCMYDNRVAFNMDAKDRRQRDFLRSVLNLPSSVLCSLSPCLEQQRLFPVALLAPALCGIEITGLPGQKVRQVASERGGHLGSWFCPSVNSLFIDVGQGSE